jgi:hypothetical protein
MLDAGGQYHARGMVSGIGSDLRDLLRRHPGLNDTSVVDCPETQWPGLGDVESNYRLAANSVLRATEGRANIGDIAYAMIFPTK